MHPPLPLIQPTFSKVFHFFCGGGGICKIHTHIAVNHKTLVLKNLISLTA